MRFLHEKIAVRKAAAMIRCMPAAVVMVDNNMNILEANDSFMKMFTGEMYDVFKARPDGLAGAAIDRIVDFADIFKTILKTGKDIHKERYHVKINYMTFQLLQLKKMKLSEL